MTKCPTCGLDSNANLCPDPIHDMADRCVELEAKLAKAVALLHSWTKGFNWTATDRMRAKHFVAKQETSDE